MSNDRTKLRSNLMMFVNMRMGCISTKTIYTNMDTYLHLIKKHMWFYRILFV